VLVLVEIWEWELDHLKLRCLFWEDAWTAGWFAKPRDGCSFLRLRVGTVLPHTTR
jgi:hypothetical protein